MHIIQAWIETDILIIQKCNHESKLHTRTSACTWTFVYIMHTMNEYHYYYTCVMSFSSLISLLFVVKCFF